MQASPTQHTRQPNPTQHMRRMPTIKHCRGKQPPNMPAPNPRVQLYHGGQSQESHCSATGKATCCAEQNRIVTCATCNSSPFHQPTRFCTVPATGFRARAAPMCTLRSATPQESALLCYGPKQQRGPAGEPAAGAARIGRAPVFNTLRPATPPGIRTRVLRGGARGPSDVMPVVSHEFLSAHELLTSNMQS
jgi:hypothetical protein